MRQSVRATSVLAPFLLVLASCLAHDPTPVLTPKAAEVVALAELHEPGLVPSLVAPEVEETGDGQAEAWIALCEPKGCNEGDPLAQTFRLLRFEHRARWECVGVVPVETPIL